ncbi:MAG: SpoIID/LytB domain-containing protein [Candidatus Aminicenantes bacterium]
MSLQRIKYIFILFLGFFFFGGIPVEFGTEGAFFHGFMIPKPVITIGLGQNLQDIRIRSSSGMKIYEVGTSYKLISGDAGEVLVKGGAEKLTEKYVLLLAYAKDRKEADQAAVELRDRIGGNVYAEENPENAAGGIFEIKLGDFLTRGDALARIQELNALGLKDIWIVREDIVEPASQPMWMVIENELKLLGRESVIYFIPANEQSFLTFNNRSYRGFFILRGTRKGVVLVNTLNLEDYLMSVVPGELSPGQFGSLEALKAQAVAARTYALKNLGQFKSLGYDLINTPRSQLYMGMSAEHPLSTQAVAETRGEVMKYKGELINALYTSTCGGKTENAENVFGGRPVPYLKSVECSTDNQPEWLLESKRPVVPIFVDGRNASLDAALLVSLGVIPVGPAPVDFRQDTSFDEGLEWARDTLKFLGIRAEGFDPAPVPLNFGNLARLLVEAFGWKDRTERLLLQTEVDFLLKELPAAQVPDRRALAYCLQSGLFPASMKAEDLGRPVTRAELAMALAGVVTAEKDIFQIGDFLSATRAGIEVGLPEGRKTLSLANHIYLLRKLDGAAAFSSKLTLLGGERVRWIEREGEISYLEVISPSNSNILDRSSRYNRWQVRKTREELEALVGQSYPIGGLVDISVKSRGSSGRALDLVVKGTEKSITLRGFPIRSALGLRDTLFVIDRTYDETGRVDTFIFTGRGWGHGVGLCQVGAYGMGLAGASYHDILKKYYKGIKIDKSP